MMRHVLFEALVAQSPVLGGEEVEPIAACCDFDTRKIDLNPWGWPGLRRNENGEFLDAGIARVSGCAEPMVSVTLTDEISATVLTYDIRRKADNAVMALPIATDTILASGTAQGHCEVTP